jgi:protein O-mannosyl-transferase
LGDSGAIVLEDPRVREVNRDNLALIFRQHYWYPTADTNVYRPLVTLSFLLNYAVLGNGDRAAGYHWVNLGLHAGNVILVWLLALTIWKQPLAAFFTAAIFAVHSVNVEAVTNIAGRADLMAGAGVLAGLVLHTRLPDAGGRGRLLGLLGMLLAALFGLFSKENAVVLPAAMLLYDLVFRLRRVAWPGYLAVAPALLTVWWVRHSVFSKLPPFEHPFVDNPLSGADFLTARLTAVKVLIKYVWLLIWPRSLAWDYSYNQIPLATWGVGLAALAGAAVMLALTLWLYRRNAPACFFGAFFFLAILPTSNLLLIIGSIMAERFLYLPSVGFAGCLVAGVLSFGRMRMALAALAVVVVAFGVRTWVRNNDWADGERFWMSALETCPNSFKTHMAPIYGWSQKGFTLGNIDQAIEEGEQAVAIVSGLPPVRSTTLPLATLGTLYRIKGDILVYKRPEEVPDWYRKSLDALTRALPIDQAYSQERRSAALAQGWRPGQIKTKGNAYLYQNLGDTYRRLGRFPEALDAFSHLMKLTPLNSAVYSQIAEINRALHKPEPAIVALWQSFALDKRAETERALRLVYRETYPDGCAEINPPCPLARPHVCSAYEGLAQVLGETGRAGEAERYRQIAVRDYGCPIR